MFNRKFKIKYLLRPPNYNIQGVSKMGDKNNAFFPHIPVTFSSIVINFGMYYPKIYAYNSV